MQRLVLGKRCVTEEKAGLHRKYILLWVWQEKPGVVVKHDVWGKQVSRTGVRMCGGLLGAPGKGGVLTAHRL